MHFAALNIAKKNWFVFRQSTKKIFVSDDGWKTMSRVRPTLTVPLNVDDVDARTIKGIGRIRSGLAEIAEGKHDDKYIELARHLVTAGSPNSIIRLGHEADHKLYPHSLRGGNHDYYKRAFRHVRSILLSVEGANFVFDYNGDGFFTKYGELGYPGNDYVDIISVNVYDRRPWTKNKFKLDWVYQFARSNGKPMAIAEWGLASTDWDPNGHNDNPTFIENMFDWMNELPESGPGSLFYAVYFNKPSKHNLDGFPNAKKRFKELFGERLNDRGN